ncbi:MAG: PPC domain-containing protein [Waterburya sp.]
MPNQSSFINNSNFSDFELPDRSTPVDRNSPVDPIDPTENTVPSNADLINPDSSDTTSIDGTEVFDLGILDTDFSAYITEDVNNRSPFDFYQFTVEESTDFSFTLDNLSADADLYLYDENAELIGTSDNYDLDAEGLDGNLTDGTYFLGVSSYDGGATDYDLTISSGEFAFSSVGADSSADLVSQESSLI